MSRFFPEKLMTLSGYQADDFFSEAETVLGTHISVRKTDGGYMAELTDREVRRLKNDAEERLSVLTQAVLRKHEGAGLLAAEESVDLSVTGDFTLEEVAEDVIRAEQLWYYILVLRGEQEPFFQIRILNAETGAVISEGSTEEKVTIKGDILHE